MDSVGSAEIKFPCDQRVNIVCHLFFNELLAYLPQSVLLHVLYYYIAAGGCYIALCVLSVAEVIGVCLHGAAVHQPNQPLGSVLKQ